uniref:Putative terminase n=1 Tax=viral metagenome TaxID=1070528 RepID=A0A6M3KZ93_9ZZZZ
MQLLTRLRAINDARSSWQPTPGPQADAYESPADELLYGGAAGGGKTDLVLGLAFNDHRRAVVFRRTYPELDDIVTRSQEIGDPEYYKVGAHEWRLPGGHIIRFRHLDRPGTERRYQGHAYDLIAFDELTHFDEPQYVFLISRNRSTVAGQRVRMIATTNPGGPGNDWVMRRWGAWIDPDHPNPERPGALRWYAMIDGYDVAVEGPEPIEHGGETITPRSRTFIPARLADNPYLGDDYRAALMSLPEPLRSQLLYGDWSAGMVTDAYQMIPSAWVSAAMERWRAREGHPIEGDLVMGIDVGRGGDVSVIAQRRGDTITHIERHSERDTMPIVGYAAMIYKAGAIKAVVDVIGIGAGVVDRLRELGHDVDAFNAGAGTSRRDATGQLEFADCRAAAWWNMRELLDPSFGREVALPPDQMLLEELTTPRWKPTSGGRIRVEGKDEIRKKLGRSTDAADAVIQAFWNESQVPSALIAETQAKLSTGSRWTAQTTPRWRRTR